MASVLHRLRFRRDHRWSLAHMSEEVDGDLDAREHARLHDHVGECPDCERVLATLQQLVGQLRDLRGSESRTVADHVLEQIKRELGDVE